MSWERTSPPSSTQGRPSDGPEGLPPVNGLPAPPGATPPGARSGARPAWPSPAPRSIGIRSPISSDLRGIALLRAFGGEYDRAFTLARLAEVRAPLDRADASGDGVSIPAMSTQEGYADWAARYDHANNALIRIEAPVVRALLDRLPVGVAFDAACGSGRHGE